MIKRFFDVSLSLMCLFFLSPVLCCIALIVYQNLGAPVLFRQTRPGKDGKPFQILKFRTMQDVADLFGNQLPDQERITAVGSFLRKTSLDELPQLLSVFKGDMSLVGPRPALYNQDDLIFLRKKKGIDKLVPGITGWAQVNGRDEIIMAQKVALDEEYLKKQSIWFDAKILWITFLKFLKKEVAGH